MKPSIVFSHAPLPRLREQPPHQAAPMSAQTLARCSTREARSFLACDTAHRLKVLPLAISEVGSRRTIVVACPHDDSVSIRFALSEEVTIRVVPEEIVTDAILIAYNQGGERVMHALSEARASVTALALNTRASAPTEIDEQGGPALFLRRIIEHAIALGASDIHFEPTEESFTMRLRLRGELLASDETLGEIALYRRIVQRVKVLASLDITQRLSSLEGRFSIIVAHRKMPIRVSIMPTYHGEKVVLRVAHTTHLLSLDELQFSSKARLHVSSVMRAEEGLAVISGATGSGKSTTLYGMAQELSRRGLSVVTIEDPVEKIVPGLSQTSIAPEQGFTYEVALRGMMRQDPDVILLGEIRDKATAQVALQAASTGHLVLTTIHGGSVLDVLHRFKEFGVDSGLLAHTLKGIFVQKLLQKLCDHCKIVDVLNSNRYGDSLFQPVGCAQCGYSGGSSMVPCAEFLTVGNEIRSVLRGKQVPDDEELIKSHEFYPMSQSEEELLRAGQIGVTRKAA
jgi:type II secretory ATPase GspE/PulE/Tfp pilus assembly ATPase PilB-like protein